jgi:two-component system, OmpR family, response regulator ChvI
MMNDLKFTLKLELEGAGLFDVNTFNDPELVLSNFKPGLYALLLLDIKMPKMTGFVLYDKLKKIGNKVRVCFITAAYVNYEAVREVFPFLELECFLQKTVELADLIGRVKAELL